MKRFALLALTLALVGCGPHVEEDTLNPLMIQFAAHVGSLSHFACSRNFYGYQGIESTTISISDLRFYVSNIRVIDFAGEEFPLILEQDGAWQYQDVVLLDFENNRNACAENSGTRETNDRVYGSTKAKDVRGLVFDLGIPPELNHANSATMPSPLNLTSMWWSWQSGYKLLRLDGATSGLDGWRLHVGSTGCTDEGSAIDCQYQNRPEIRLDGGYTPYSTVALDVERLLKNVDLSKDEGGAVGCMSAEDDPECVPIFESLGVKGESQTAFYIHN